MKMNRPLGALYAAVLILILASILVFSAISDAASTSPSSTTVPGCLPYRPERCPAEHLDTLAPPTSIPETTTSTTIDLSFLNTTTTSTPVRTSSVQTSTTSTPITTESISDRWDVLAKCETGGDWTANTGNGYGGGLQFAHGPGWSTWRAYGGEEFSAHPWEATREEQIVIAERVLAGSGWRAWPGCSRLNGWIS